MEIVDPCQCLRYNIQIKQRPCSNRIESWKKQAIFLDKSFVLVAGPDLHPQIK